MIQLILYLQKKKTYYSAIHTELDKDNAGIIMFSVRIFVKKSLDFNQNTPI